MDQHGPTHLTRRTLLGASAAAAGFVAAASASPAAAAPGGAYVAARRGRQGPRAALRLARHRDSGRLPLVVAGRAGGPGGGRPGGRPGRRRRLRRSRGRGRHHSLRARKIDLDRRRTAGAPPLGRRREGGPGAGRRARRAHRPHRRPAWPAAVSTITPDDDAAAPNSPTAWPVPAGTTYQGPVPEPVHKAASTVTRRRLLARRSGRPRRARQRPPARRPASTARASTCAATSATDA